VIAPLTLHWFIEAFDMTPADAAELWALRSGRDPARLAVVRTAHIPDRPRGPRPDYQTIALHEFHTVGPDGLPARHRTVHVIRAVDTVASYHYRFDTDAAAVEVVRGGTAGPLYRATEDGLYGVEITFQRPLQPGETASFEYRTLFRYRDPPPPEFRRGGQRRVDNLELLVRFHPDRLPEKIWWAIWDDYPVRSPRHEEPVRLEPDHSTHRYLDTLEGHTVGFHWRFRGFAGYASTPQGSSAYPRAPWR
jgi:hypothetical protein